MCSSSEDKFGRVMIWIITTWIKEDYKANMSAAAPEVAQELLNTTGVWFRWRFGAGLWGCSALTVTEMGTHILQALSLGRREKGGGHWADVTCRRAAVHGSRHTGDQHTRHSQPTSVSWREEMHQGSLPTSCTWSPCSSQRGAMWGRKRENINEPTLLAAQRLASGYLSRDRWGYVH